VNVAAVAELLGQRIGLDPLSLGVNVLPHVVAERMRALKMVDVPHYVEHLSHCAAEFSALVEEVVVSETWFFRGGKVFPFLVERVRRAAAAPFRILSAACCSGEEPYSLALALLESGVPRAKWMLEAVDLSARNLAKARRGCYRESAFRETDDDMRRKYFHENDGEWELDAAVRKTVRFRSGNLLDERLLEGEEQFNVIFVRNILIYLHAAARQRVLANLDRLLKPDGLLCVGHAEPLNLFDDRFQATGPHEFFLFERRQNISRPSRHSAVPTTPPRRPASRRASAARVEMKPTPSVDLLQQARSEADAGALDAALRSCRTHLAGAEPSAQGYSLLGVIHRARKEKAEAEACFRKALYLDPHHEEALTHLLLLAQEDGAEAAAARLRRRLNRLSAGGEA
jgi:chemotaxis protein methyltransferase WspC